MPGVREGVKLMSEQERRHWLMVEAKDKELFAVLMDAMNRLEKSGVLYGPDWKDWFERARKVFDPMPLIAFDQMCPGCKAIIKHGFDSIPGSLHREIPVPSEIIESANKGAAPCR